jgi:hypothetical protein
LLILAKGEETMRNGIRLLVFWLALAALGWTYEGAAATYTVVNTGDAGAGSLRQAILDANSHAGPDTIMFNIPKTGWLFNGSAWYIQPESDFPALTDNGTVIDGTSQAANQGDTNTLGPEVVITGYAWKNSKPVMNGFTIHSADNVIKGLSISSFNQIAITVTTPAAIHNRILGNYIGLNFTGQDTMDSPNHIGIFMDNHARHNLVGGTSVEERNVISGNRWSGVYFFQSDSNRVIGNYIGADMDGMHALGNRDNGVEIWGSIGNTIGGLLPGESNLISGNQKGVVVYDEGSSGNRILGNKIGTDAAGLAGITGQSWGIVISSGKKNQIGPANIIRFNQYYGVYITSPATLGNTITQNSISDNSGHAIALVTEANGGVQPPVVNRTAQGISGTTLAFATVEIFSDPAGEGLIYEGSATADASGAFSWTGSLTGPNVTATMTDADGNTSQFSVPVSISAVQAAEHNSQPTEFALLQNYPNPFNPLTTVRFTLPQKAHVVLKVFDLQGREIAAMANDTMPAGEHAFHFNGSGLASGVYYCRMWAGSYCATRKMVLLE